MKSLRNIKTNLAIIITVIFAIMLIIAFQNQIIDFADQHIALEKQHPNYYALVKSHAEKTINENIAQNGTNNLIINSLYTNTSDQGFTITVNEDGSFTYSGTNNSTDEVILTIAPYCLPRGNGTYVVTDTKTLNDLEVSQDGISVFLQNQSYEIGGNTDYPLLYSLKNGPQTVTVDENDHTDYYLNLAIEPGYTSDGITFYPMITTQESMSSEYQPCVILDTSALTNSTITYDYYQLGKNEFLNLNEDELQKFYNILKYQMSGSWVTLDFQDGTGLVFSKDVNDMFNVENPSYGYLNAMGRLSLESGGLNDINEENKPLIETLSFDDYLAKLNDPNYTVFISVRDDGFSELLNRSNADLRSLGIYIDISEALYQNSFYAVINPGNNTIEQASTQPLSFSGTLADGTYYQIISRGHLAGEDNASINVNGQEYSMNRRGMNFVVYDNTQHKVVDTVCFDTCSGLHFYRPLYITEQ